MSKKIFEDAAGGSVGAGSIAGNRGYSIFGQKTSPMSRAIPDIDNIPVMKFKHDNRRWVKKFRRLPAFSLMSYVKEEFNLSDALSKLNNATGQSKTKNDRNNTVLFGLEDDKGNMIKVYVDAKDADRFEEELGKELEENMKKIEIAELLFRLRDEFSITNVVWPKIVDDVVEEEEVNKGESDQNADADLTDDFENDTDNAFDEGGDEGVTDEETTPHQAGPNDIDVNDLEQKEDFSTNDSKETLNAILSMLAADAEAKKAEADAKAAEARAKEAEAMARTAEARIKSEEQILDMESYNKQKSNEKAETRKLAKLAQYRHELKREKQQQNMDPNVVDINTDDARRYVGEEEEENSTVKSLRPISIETLIKIARKMQEHEVAQE